LAGKSPELRKFNVIEDHCPRVPNFYFQGCRYTLSLFPPEEVPPPRNLATHDGLHALLVIILGKADLLNKHISQIYPFDIGTLCVVLVELEPEDQSIPEHL
jgi:hypothetical protein